MTPAPQGDFPYAAPPMHSTSQSNWRAPPPQRWQQPHHFDVGPYANSAPYANPPPFAAMYQPGLVSPHGSPHGSPHSPAMTPLVQHPGNGHHLDWTRIPAGPAHSSPAAASTAATVPPQGSAYLAHAPQERMVDSAHHYYNGSSGYSSMPVPSAPAIPPYGSYHQYQSPHSHNQHYHHPHHHSLHPSYAEPRPGVRGAYPAYLGYQYPDQSAPYDASVQEFFRYPYYHAGSSQLVMAGPPPGFVMSPDVGMDGEPISQMLGVEGVQYNDDNSSSGDENYQDEDVNSESGKAQGAAGAVDSAIPQGRKPKAAKGSPGPMIANAAAEGARQVRREGRLAEIEIGAAMSPRISEVTGAVAKRPRPPRPRAAPGKKWPLQPGEITALVASMQRCKYTPAENQFLRHARRLEIPWSTKAEVMAQFFTENMRRTGKNMQVHYSQNVKLRIGLFSELSPQQQREFEELFKKKLAALFNGVSSEYANHFDIAIQPKLVSAYMKFVIDKSRRRLEAGLSCAVAAKESRLVRTRPKRKPEPGNSDEDLAAHTLATTSEAPNTDGTVQE